MTRLSGITPSAPPTWQLLGASGLGAEGSRATCTS